MYLVARFMPDIGFSVTFYPATSGFHSNTKMAEMLVTITTGPHRINEPVSAPVLNVFCEA